MRILISIYSYWLFKIPIKINAGPYGLIYWLASPGLTYNARITHILARSVQDTLGRGDLYRPRSLGLTFGEAICIGLDSHSGEAIYKCLGLTFGGGNLYRPALGDRGIEAQHGKVVVVVAVLIHRMEHHPGYPGAWSTREVHGRLKEANSKGVPAILFTISCQYFVRVLLIKKYLKTCESHINSGTAQEQELHWSGRRLPTMFLTWQVEASTATHVTSSRWLETSLLLTRHDLTSWRPPLLLTWHGLAGWNLFCYSRDLAGKVEVFPECLSLDMAWRLILCLLLTWHDRAGWRAPLLFWVEQGQGLLDWTPRARCTCPSRNCRRNVSLSVQLVALFGLRRESRFLVFYYSL